MPSTNIRRPSDNVMSTRCAKAGSVNVGVETHISECDDTDVASAISTDTNPTSSAIDGGHYHHSPSDVTAGKPDGYAATVFANLNPATRPASLELRKGSAQQALTATISKERNRNGFYT